MAAVLRVAGHAEALRTDSVPARCGVFGLSLSPKTSEPDRSRGVLGRSAASERGASIGLTRGGGPRVFEAAVEWVRLLLMLATPSSCDSDLVRVTRVDDAVGAVYEGRRCGFASACESTRGTRGISILGSYLGTHLRFVHHDVARFEFCSSEVVSYPVIPKLEPPVTPPRWVRVLQSYFATTKK